jgi:putative DNA primase/helicase
MHQALKAHLAKYRSLAPSLALLCHLIDNPQGGAVSEESTLRALAWCEYLESHAQRLYSQAHSPEVVSAIQLDRHIKRGDVDMEFNQPFQALHR